METSAVKMTELPKFNYSNFLTIPDFFGLEKKDYSKMTEEELLEELKKSEVFDKLVFPNSWYDKYELPEKKCQNMKEFIAESAWMKRSYNYYIEKMDIPAKPGGNRPILEIEPVKAEVLLENSFSDAPKGQIADANPEEKTE